MRTNLEDVVIQSWLLTEQLQSYQAGQVGVSVEAGFDLEKTQDKPLLVEKNMTDFHFSTQLIFFKL